jgi:CheY-like chemotaxis protein/HPt (histidine-containing phosphotransfer) domain-containing protein
LSIVRRLIEMMGGTVGVESELGVGSRFWFELPLAALEAQPSPPLAEQRGKRAMVVDDTATQRDVLARHLRSAGYDVTAISEGAVALTELRAAARSLRPYDAVLIDQRLIDMDGTLLGREIASDPHIGHARAVLLTTLDRPADVQHFVALGFAGSVAKPVRIRELLRCLDRVLASESQQWHLRSGPTQAHEPTAGERQLAGRVLLVEDNAVNQKVAKRFLEQLGCTVHIAANGAEAVDEFKARTYDIVLMDLQMPVMDGLMATRHIRDHEASGRSSASLPTPNSGAQPRTGRTPIVALTANAMVGQQERCLAAGMDGYLTKPLAIERLREMLGRFLPSDRTAEHSSERTHLETPSAQLVDLARFDAVTGGDAAFANELIVAFATSCTEIEREMDAAVATDDRKALARAAHKLKGSAANIHAHLLRLHAEELESCAATFDATQLEIHLAQMRVYVVRTTEYLRGARQSPPSSSLYFA